MNDIMPVTSFLNYVETVENEVRKSGYSLGSDNILLYRGQQSANWKLRPSIAVKWKSRRNEEKRFGDLERELFEDFQKRTFPFLQSIPESRLDWLTLAQHHQLPTRLLDWSANAFTALWFVVSKKATARATTGRSDDDSEFGAVWIFRTERHDWLEPELEESIDIFNPPKLLVYMPRSVTGRVPAQFGFFTIHPDKDGHFEPLDDHPDYKSKVNKIPIPRSCFPEFREALDRMGINDFSLFPGLDGLARRVRWYHFREDDV
jgi:FRG domain